MGERSACHLNASPFKLGGRWATHGMHNGHVAGRVIGTILRRDRKVAALREDVATRFIGAQRTSDPRAIAGIVLEFLDRTAEARNLARFS